MKKPARKSVDTSAYDRDEKFVAEYFGVGVETVRGWRKRSVGPEYIKLDGHLIRYRAEDLAAWAQKQRRDVTNERRKAAEAATTSTPTAA